MTDEVMEYRHPRYEVDVTRVRTKPIVIEGVDLIVPDAPLGEVGVYLDARMIPVRVVSVAFAALAASRTIYTGPGLYMGHSMAEPTGVAGATIDIIDGQDDGGTLLAPITLVQNESTRDWYPLPGITITEGIRIKVIAGQVRGAVYLGVNDLRTGQADG